MLLWPVLLDRILHGDINLNRSFPVSGEACSDGYPLLSVRFAGRIGMAGKSLAEYFYGAVCWQCSNARPSAENFLYYGASRSAHHNVIRLSSRYAAEYPQKSDQRWFQQAAEEWPGSYLLFFSWRPSRQRAARLKSPWPSGISMVLSTLWHPRQ